MVLYIPLCALYMYIYVFMYRGRSRISVGGVNPLWGHQHIMLQHIISPQGYQPHRMGTNPTGWASVGDPEEGINTTWWAPTPWGGYQPIIWQTIVSSGSSIHLRVMKLKQWGGGGGVENSYYIDLQLSVVRCYFNFFFRKRISVYSLWSVRST